MSVMKAILCLSIILIFYPTRIIFSTPQDSYSELGLNSEKIDTASIQIKFVKFLIFDGILWFYIDIWLTWKQSRTMLRSIFSFPWSKSVLKGSTLIDCLTLREAGASFFFTHWMPKWIKNLKTHDLIYELIDSINNRGHDLL